MSENVRNKVKELLGSGIISGFLGLSNKYGHIGPHLFTDINDLGHLVVGDWEQPRGIRGIPSISSLYTLPQNTLTRPLEFWCGAVTSVG